jgi:pilus assembly protein Flp/PilA
MFLRICERLTKNEEGATAVEYGVMVALVAVVIIAAVTLLGSQLSTLFSRIASALGG